jgi:hypothetical protein
LLPFLYISVSPISARRSATMTAMKMHTDSLSQKTILFEIIQKVTGFVVNLKSQSDF